MASAFSTMVREDTMFGACHAVGEDFGFNPTYLRALFAVLFFWSPPVAAGAYALLLTVVVATRWLIPDPGAIEPETAAAANEDERQEELPLAA